MNDPNFQFLRSEPVTIRFTPKSFEETIVLRSKKPYLGSCEAGELPMRARMLVPIIDRTDNQVKLLDLSPTIYHRLLKQVENTPVRKLPWWKRLWNWLLGQPTEYKITDFEYGKDVVLHKNHLENTSQEWVVMHKESPITQKQIDDLSCLMDYAKELRMYEENGR